mmetsp:Transcript_19392/g.65014  ORF Transcript_19392/g.65014 Transcript_19392/m.65014 type:complete len:210 (+) Transcript_19392:432-1061(+)
MGGRVHEFLHPSGLAPRPRAHRRREPRQDGGPHQSRRAGRCAHHCGGGGAGHLQSARGHLGARGRGGARDLAAMGRAGPPDGIGEAPLPRRVRALLPAPACAATHGEELPGVLPVPRLHGPERALLRCRLPDGPLVPWALAAVPSDLLVGFRAIRAPSSFQSNSLSGGPGPTSPSPDKRLFTRTGGRRSVPMWIVRSLVRRCRPCFIMR